MRAKKHLSPLGLALVSAMRFAAIAIPATLWLMSCQRSSSMPPPAPSPAQEARVAGRYLPFFDELVEQIKKQHVFAPSYDQIMGGTFAEAVVPVLRARMAAARDRSEAIAVIAQLQNSIRDGHCRYEAPADVHGSELSLGLGLHAIFEKTAQGSQPIVRVAEHTPSRSHGDGAAVPEALPVGSRLTGIDGVEVGAWLAAHRFATNILEPNIALQRTADSIVVDFSDRSELAAGARRTLAFVRPDGIPGQLTLSFGESEDEEEDGPSVDHPPPTSAISCDAAIPHPYGAGYALTATGVFLCVYTPVRGPKVPIVRYLSFYYSDGRRRSAAILRQIKVDHQILKTALVGAQGVILDLHKNNGGNNPFLFFRWFAKKPWSHEVVRTRVVPELPEAQLRELFEADRLKEYRAAQKSGKPFIESRFLCLPPTDQPKAEPRCDDVPPSDSEQVTPALVAVIVGPQCLSSCDSFALSWSRFREGPLVGRQPMHAYTVQRRKFALTGPKGESLGQFCVGMSSSHLGSERPIEGEPIKLDVEIPDRFENRDTWVYEAVEQATKLLLRSAGNRMLAAPG